MSEEWPLPCPIRSSPCHSGRADRRRIALGAGYLTTGGEEEMRIFKASYFAASSLRWFTVPTDFAATARSVRTWLSHRPRRGIQRRVA
jgi:hypothetical protein